MLPQLKPKSVIALSVSFILVIAFLAGCSKDSLNWMKGNPPSIQISGVSYPPDTTELTIKEFDSDDYSVFAEFENLKTLDVTALDLSVSDFERLASQTGEGVDIIWSVPIKGGILPSNTTALSFSSDYSSDDIHNVQYFKDIQSLTIAGAEVNDELYALIKNATDNNPDLQLNCSASLYGVEFDNSTERLILNNIPIDSPDRLCLAIEIFPGLKAIEMCDCGLSNEIMQGLREEYPDIQFVWTIRFLHFKVRTDVQVFSTLATNFNRPGNSETFAPIFKYCTELRALDLGHMAITDISEIRNLKKLHTLILADNYITDISPLADLKELNYVELFQNRISDISPLLELPHLEDLNMCYNSRLQNPTVLTECKNLNRLYISHCSLDWDEIKQLRNGIPQGCEFNYTAANCVYDGWRDNAKNATIRKAFKNWKKVKEYPSWDNIIYQ